MRIAVLAAAAAFALGAGQAHAQTSEMKVAHYMPPPHFMSLWLEKWGNKLAQDSGGKIKPEFFPASQMGPVPRYYDMARQGVAQVTFFLHGATPGRFPLTEVINLPFMVGSAEIGTKVLNDPALRAMLEPEHKDIKLLFLLTHQPGNVYTSKKAIRLPEDMKGMRLRFASATIKDWVERLGATPVGLPPTEMAEGLQKGSIDGVFIDYGGAGIAFKLGPHLKYATEMYSFVASFGVGMNQAFYDGLSPELKKLVDDSVADVSAEVGQGWDALDAVGKKSLTDAGVEPIKLTADQMANFRKLGDALAADHIAKLEADGKPGKQVYDLMKQLSAKYEKNSKSFWE